MSGLYTWVMDVSSLNLGPENWTGRRAGDRGTGRRRLTGGCGREAASPALNIGRSPRRVAFLRFTRSAKIALGGTACEH